MYKLCTSLYCLFVLLCTLLTTTMNAYAICPEWNATSYLRSRNDIVQALSSVWTGYTPNRFNAISDILVSLSCLQLTLDGISKPLLSMSAMMKCSNGVHCEDYYEPCFRYVHVMRENSCQPMTIGFLPLPARHSSSYEHSGLAICSSRSRLYF